jgi:cellobiose-specific phosphotransferase system component IIC
VAESPRKRKERGGAGGSGGAAANGNGSAGSNRTTPRPTPQERMRAGYAKAEVRNQAAREALEPLAEGERPAVVTVGAILAALIALSIVISYAAGVKVNGSTPHFTAVAAPVLILGVMAWGMWRARYWAVLGFQVILVFLIFTAVYGLLVEATSVTEFAVTVGLLAVSGTLFWLMVKAMARIQMPERVPPQ